MIDDPSIFNDIAEALNAEKGYNIQAAFIEKDYYAVQLLNLVNGLALKDCSLIFSGGTCLSKALYQLKIVFLHQNLNVSKVHNRY